MSGIPGTSKEAVRRGMEVESGFASPACLSLKDAVRQIFVSRLDP